MDAPFFGAFAAPVTWAARPASPYVGQRIRLTDYGNREMYWDGSVWQQVGNKPWSQSGVPVGIPSSGSIGNNGALTLTTAFPTTYAGIYLYFPANAIVIGSAAGLYYCVMSSTTVGTIYNNTYSSGDPTIPANPTPFVTTGPGAYTQTTAEISLRSVVVPGGMMSAVSGALRYMLMFNYPTNANGKFTRLKFAGTNIIDIGNTTTTNITLMQVTRNRGSASLQISQSSAITGLGGTSSSQILTTANTAADVTVVASGQIAVATDFVISDALTMEVFS